MAFKIARCKYENKIDPFCEWIILLFFSKILHIIFNCHNTLDYNQIKRQVGWALYFNHGLFLFKKWSPFLALRPKLQQPNIFQSYSYDVWRIIKSTKSCWQQHKKIWNYFSPHTKSLDDCYSKKEELTNYS